MKYQELSPSPALQPFIECFWLLQGTPPRGQSQTEAILPDGCMELIFHRGEPFTRFLDATREEKQSQSFVVGQMESPASLRLSNRVDVLGVRFHPGGAHPFFPQPLSEISGRFLSLEEIWGARGKELQHQVLEALSVHKAVQVLEEAFTQRLLQSGGELHRVQKISRLMVEAHGSIPIRGLASSAGISERQLEREFRCHLGLTPKRFARILRFQHVFKAMERSTNWVDIALGCGYYDQAHLIRDFRQFAGASPSSFQLQEFEPAQYFLRAKRVSHFSNTKREQYSILDLPPR